MNAAKPALSARDIIRLLGREPHPEGGHFRETFRDRAADASGRSVGTAIYYLLEAGEVSEWHRVDATEIWHYYAGAPMVITISPNGHDAAAHHLGPALDAGQRPQIVVEAGHWQSATSLGPGLRRLHRGTWLPFRGLRDGAEGLATRPAAIRRMTRCRLSILPQAPAGCPTWR